MEHDHEHHDHHGHDDDGHEHGRQGRSPHERDRNYGKKVRREWEKVGTPENLAEQMVAPTLRGRESNCSHGCGSGGGCSTGGCGVGSIVDLVVTDFGYDDARRLIEVEYKGARREFVDVEDLDLPLRVNDLVLVESEKGIDGGYVSMTGSLVHAKRKAKKLSGEPVSKLLRKANAEDAERFTRNRASELEAIRVCRTRIESFALPMKLVDAEWQFDHRRVTFFFTADGRVDFRELVRDLAAIFRTRIELRQIAVRDEAKRIGGVGICGKELCCTTHLGRYEHITLDHAKAQGLQINPTKLSGQCGRLKCCLLYELDNYVEGLKRFPPMESTIRTAMGEGRVQKVDIFRDLVYLYHTATDQWEKLTLDELKALATRPPREADRPGPPRERGNGARERQGAGRKMEEGG